VLELPGGHVGIVAGRRASEQLWPKLADWLIARATPLPPPSDHPPPHRRAPADIAASLQAGVAVAQQVDATQTMIEAISPLESMRQALPAEPGADSQTSPPDTPCTA
jgi:hypothetical protein